MKLILTILAAVAATVTTAFSQTLRTENMLKEWEFRKGHDITAADGWENVSVPHDWAIYGPFDKTNDLQTVAVTQNGYRKDRKNRRPPLYGKGFVPTLSGDKCGRSGGKEACNPV